MFKMSHSPRGGRGFRGGFQGNPFNKNYNSMGYNYKTRAREEYERRTGHVDNGMRGREEYERHTGHVDNGMRGREEYERRTGHVDNGMRGREEHWQTSNNRVNNRGLNTFKNNNFQIRPHKRSHSWGSNLPSQGESDFQVKDEHYIPGQENICGKNAYRLPSHANNPIFNNLLSPRFNSIMPSPGLLTADEPEQTNYNFEKLSYKHLVNPDNVNSVPNSNYMNTAETSSSQDCGDSSFYDDYDQYNQRQSYFKESDPELPLRSSVEPQLVVSNDKSQFRFSTDNNRNSQFSTSKDTSNTEDNSSEERARRLQSTFVSDYKNFQSVISPYRNERGQPGSLNTNRNRLSTLQSERRKQILIANGFKVKEKYLKENISNSINTNETNTQQGGSTQSTLETTSISPIEDFESNTNCFSKTPGPSSDNSLKPHDNSRINVLPSFPPSHSTMIDNEKEAPPLQQGRSNVSTENTNPLLNLSKPEPLTHNYLELTRGAVAGGPQCNIQQKISHSGQRVPSRTEALQKKQDEYDVKLREYEAKERAKEAKKREQFLAKYKHAVPGRRLSEAYLNEAAGYAHTVASNFNSEEEVRKRQQDQHMRDALVFQELEKKESGRRNKKEEEKIRQYLEKYKYLDAGYILGDKKNQGPGKDIHAGALTANIMQTGTPMDPDSKEGQAERGKIVPQLPKFTAKLSLRSIQEPSNARKLACEAKKSSKFSSCVLNDPTEGTMLVLRPSEEALNLALAQKLTVYDEMDKQGYSALYKPQVEQALPYSTYRFEQQQLSDVAKSTGAIPKQKATSSTKLLASSLELTAPAGVPTNQGIDANTGVPTNKGIDANTGVPTNKGIDANTGVPTNKGIDANTGVPTNQDIDAPGQCLDAPVVQPTKPEVPKIDHQAGMRAARLRMQKLYEESLKNQEE